MVMTEPSCGDCEAATEAVALAGFDAEEVTAGALSVEEVEFDAELVAEMETTSVVVASLVAEIVTVVAWFVSSGEAVIVVVTTELPDPVSSPPLPDCP